MDTQQIAQVWLDKCTDETLRSELSNLLGQGSRAEIEDAFYQELSFGTAGLRGILGPGTNRMNVYTVRKATQGLADYLNKTFPTITPSVAIARDSRHMGYKFVEEAASVLAANGIKSYLYPRIEPTPALSFAVRHLKCQAGINMTASHNPSNYNGYKVYDETGCQITTKIAQAISNAIDAIDPFTDVKTMEFSNAEQAGLVCWIEDKTIQSFIDEVAKLSVYKKAESNEMLTLAYTPLCGAGRECMLQIFNKLPFCRIELVPSQAQPDGNFPGCTYPNPEEKEALSEGIKLCKEKGFDLLLASDPDADRVGIAVKHGQDFVLPSGNEIGILLFDFICQMRSKEATLPENPLCVSTIVSTMMINAIAQKYNVEIKRTLTGFKYIGEIINSLEQMGEQDRFIFGFEESYGYLSGSHVRDKDAINAGLLVCEMAAYYKNKNLDLISALDALYETYGYYLNKTINIAFPGAQGSRNMTRLMDSLRDSYPKTFGPYKVQKALDYQGGIDDLPSANVVELQLEQNSKVIFRPSGTEPKIKVYLFTYSSTKEDSSNKLAELEQVASAFVHV